MEPQLNQALAGTFSLSALPSAPPCVGFDRCHIVTVGPVERSISDPAALFHADQFLRCAGLPPPPAPRPPFTAFRICHKIKSPFRLLINSTHRRCLLPRKPLTTAQVTGPFR